MSFSSTTSTRSCLLLLISVIAVWTRVAFAGEAVNTGLTEQVRLEIYAERNYTWPPQYMVPNTVGWRQLQHKRIAQVERIADPTERYNGWVAAMTAAITAPNFTENGWGLTRAPEGLLKELQESLRNGLDNAPLESRVDVIEGDDESSRPLFIKQEALNRKVLEELKPAHEAWSGIDLVGSIAYGLRVYRNGSNLLMHIDKAHTHIISCILHVDHSEDSEPWPIFIEDFQGNVNEVVLEAGDMMFYESSKCIHGRPRTFKGSWYSSIFVHYHPVGWEPENRNLEGHYAVPPRWRHQMEERDDLEHLIMIGTSMKEPGCQDLYCNSQKSIKWQGPAKEGVIMTTGWDAATTMPSLDEL
mmetsp:Transcript_13891/g.21083  ORF Transcript_13891/g.21083 Transcript_13891/m.21083 type:complete len:357 (-) Transcript_13891:35-1105(-)